MRSSKARGTVTWRAILGASVVGAYVALTTFGARAAPPVSFHRDVLPIFQQHCVTCHSPGQLAVKAIGLNLDTYAGLMAGSEFGTAIIPGHPELSPLIHTLVPDLPSYKDLKMPPLGPPLSPAEIHTISQWIKEGAKDN